MYYSHEIWTPSETNKAYCIKHPKGVPPVYSSYRIHNTLRTFCARTGEASYYTQIAGAKILVHPAAQQNILNLLNRSNVQKKKK